MIDRLRRKISRANARRHDATTPQRHEVRDEVDDLVARLDWAEEEFVEVDWAVDLVDELVQSETKDEAVGVFSRIEEFFDEKARSSIPDSEQRDDFQVSYPSAATAVTFTEYPGYELRSSTEEGLAASDIIEAHARSLLKSKVGSSTITAMQRFRSEAKCAGVGTLALVSSWLTDCSSNAPPLLSSFDGKRSGPYYDTYSTAAVCRALLKTVKLDPATQINEQMENLPVWELCRTINWFARLGWLKDLVRHGVVDQLASIAASLSPRTTTTTQPDDGTSDVVDVPILQSC